MMPTGMEAHNDKCHNANGIYSNQDRKEEAVTMQ